MYWFLGTAFVFALSVLLFTGFYTLFLYLHREVSRFGGFGRYDNHSLSQLIHEYFLIIKEQKTRHINRI